MTFAARPLLAGTATGFIPVTRTYTSGSGTETVPAGATKLVITDQGAGAAGYSNLSNNFGGGAGGEAVRTITVAGGDVLAWAVGAGSASNSLQPGGNSSVSGTVAGGAVNMVAQGGQRAGNGFGAGGVASGGDTNTTGGAAVFDVGGTSPYGPAYGNGGSGATIPGQAGQGGIITFAYT